MFHRYVALVTSVIRLITIHALELPCTASISTLHLEDTETEGETRPCRHISRETIVDTFCWVLVLRER